MTVAVYPSHLSPPRHSAASGSGRTGFRHLRRRSDHPARAGAFFRENDIVVTIVMQFDNIQSIKEAVALGSGISILPERTMQAEVEQKRLVSMPLHAPELVRPTAIIHRRKKRFTQVGREFLALVNASHLPEARGTAPGPKKQVRASGRNVHAVIH